MIYKWFAGFTLLLIFSHVHRDRIRSLRFSYQNFVRISHVALPWYSRTASLSVGMAIFSASLRNQTDFLPCGPDSVLGIAPRYGLDGPGIELRWGRDFPLLSRPALENPVACTMGTGSFPGGKATWSWC